VQKKNAITGLFGLILILFITINGCDIGDNNPGNSGNDEGNGGDNGNEGGNKGFLELVRMDIEDAHDLAIVPDASTGEDELYKVTNNGDVEKVKYYDKDQNETSVSSRPSEIYNVDSNYVIICYGSEGYLTRKNDGAVFSLKDVGIPTSSAQGGNAYGTKIIQQDLQGNIYYGIQPIPYALIKLDISNPENITKTSVISQTQGTNGAFDVAPDGTIIFGDFVIRKTNAGLFYATNSSSLAPWWIGLDGKIRYAHPGGYVTGISISTITIDGDFNQLITTEDYAYAQGTGGSNFYFWGRATLVKFNNRVIFVYANAKSGDLTSYNDTGIYEVENPTGAKVVRMVPLSHRLRSYKNIAYSNDSIYLFGNDINDQPTLVKVNPNNNVTTVLLNPGTYDVYKISIGPNNTVSFNALQMFDGAIVIGEISASGQVKILDTTLNTEVIVLERIR
jgi:hypothetical protein